MSSLTAAEQQMVRAVWSYYRTNGRHDLPWRQTDDPYRIVVSEIMLQQTQVQRVIPKYREFLRAFPSTKRLAEAPLGSVLGRWQGLGYNRRAKMLQQAAAVVHEEYHGRWPRSEEALKKLPGIGTYTAAAVVAFAYDTPTCLLETNVKTVLLAHLFPGEEMVTETQLYDALEQVTDRSQPREWYWAVMDYGSFLKQTHPYIHRRVKGYRKQSPFRGSDREVRGAILRLLHQQGAVQPDALLRELSFPTSKVRAQIERLATEGLVVQDMQTSSWQLPE